MQIGTNGLWGKDMKRSILGSTGQKLRSRYAEIGQKIPYSEISQEVFDEF